LIPAVCGVVKAPKLLYITPIFILGEWFNVRKGTSQGDPVLPYVFITWMQTM